MAETSNPQVVHFANERIRPLADKFARLRADCAQIVADWNAQNVAAPIEANGAGELIADGSAVDGRPRITGGQIYNMITLATDFATAASPFMTSGRQDVVNGVKVQP